MINKAPTSNTSDCPVPDDMLGRLYRSPAQGVIQTVSTLPVVQRARLAVFCYGRAHLNDLAMAIGSTCDRETLVDVAHRVGEAIYLQSRERPAQQLAERAQPGRRNITLASSATSGHASRPFEDEPVDESALEEIAEDTPVAAAENAEAGREQEIVVERHYPALVVGF